MSVGEMGFVGGEEIVEVAVATVDARGAHADSAIVPKMRLNKMYFFMVENLRALRCALIAYKGRLEFYLRSTTLSFHKPPWFADK